LASTSADRKPTRDYPALSTSPWTLWELMFARRSCRKYGDGALGEEVPGELAELLALSTGVRRARADSIIAVTDPREVAALKQRSYKGLPNKINVWLARSPIRAFLALSVPEQDAYGPRPLETPKAAMALEDCVLWLTARGLGTCWLGGVNSGELKALLGLEESMTVPLVVCVGRPREAIVTLSFDNLMRNVLSRRRKPLEAVACLENLDRPYRPVSITPGGFSASAVQDISGLLGMLRDGSGGGDAPLELAIEASLEAGRIAPSAGNFQPWHFVVVRDESRLERLAAACGSEPGWRAAIVATGKAEGYRGGMIDKPFWMIDIPIALSHISLMATSAGCRARVFIDGIDERAVNDLVGATGTERTIGVMGIS
jgi:nitroreductase